MRRIAQANVDKLSALLTTETDPTRRAMELKLLAEEAAKLAEPSDPDQRKAY